MKKSQIGKLIETKANGELNLYVYLYIYDMRRKFRMRFIERQFN